ncbi:MAG TPA: hypothetical protein VK864_10490, partial [Longimicrobiales bacterium]|nr:hypothetical protein [Longimicrobiales bacterium]
NVYVAGLARSDANEVARALREEHSGLAGVRALAFALPRRGALQISMNLEDPERTPPARVFDFLESAVAARGGTITETEVIGLMPDQLAVSVAAARMKLQPGTGERLLSRKVAEYLAALTRPSSNEANEVSR